MVDHLADAMPIDALPFVDQTVLSAASAEPGEPTACFVEGLDELRRGELEPA